RLRWRDGKGIGTDCGCLGVDRSGQSVHSPYEALVLEHVAPNQKVAVNSLRDAAAMEQKYGVVHAVTSYGENYQQPDQKPITFRDVYRPLRERGIITDHIRR